MPEISDPLKVMDCTTEVQRGLKLILSEVEPEQTLLDYLESVRRSSTSSDEAENVSIVIGPEGGWTQIEIAAFIQHGWQSISLGPRILRAETAAIAVTSVLSQWMQR